MTVSFRWRIVMRVALCIPLAPGLLLAQANREALVDSARTLIDNFNERQSIAVLQRALNPALGAPDAAWDRGVQLLAQTLLQTDRGPEAAAWLRWALRQSPTFDVDRVTFTPRLVAAFEEARAFVARSRPEPRAGIRFEWATVTSDSGSGDLRIESGDGALAALLQLSVDGIGAVNIARPRRLSPGSYRILARTTGAADADVTTEVLSGVTTVVTLAMTPAPVAPAGALTVSTEREVRSRLTRIASRRTGGSSCGVGLFTGRPGLLLTSYRTIRGAELLSLRLANATIEDEGVRVAAYDVNADLALLFVAPARGDSSLLAQVGDARGDLWAARFPDCGDMPSLTKVTALAASGSSIPLAEDVPNAEQGGVLITSNGALAGILVGPRAARTAASAAALLAAAEQSVAAGSLLHAREVALREKHALGEVTLTSPTAGAKARITPLESWQWRESARTDALPFTFRGPMGRYQVEVFDGERITSRTEIQVQPGTSSQIALGQQRKGRSKLLPILGGVAAGGIVAVLAGGGEKKPPPTPPPTTGGITFRLP